MSRTKGASSCVFVCLEDLNRVFKPNAMIPVHRNFLRMVGIEGDAFSVSQVFSKKEPTQVEIVEEDIPPQVSVTENL